MSKQSQKEPDAWNRARMAARKIKLAGEKAAMDEIGHVPSPERSASPCTVATSARGASVAPPRDEVRRVKSESPDPPKPEKQKSRKRKSSSSSSSRHKKSAGSKGNRRMVFKFY